MVLSLMVSSAGLHAAEPKLLSETCVMGNEPNSSWFGRYAIVRWAVKVKQAPSRWYYVLQFPDRNDFLGTDLFDVDYVERNAVIVNRKFCSF